MDKPALDQLQYSLSWSASHPTLLVSHLPSKRCQAVTLSRPPTWTFLGYRFLVSQAEGTV
jgi:hypothetical protein